jgi:quercetin dioxygenase-like cupin family protein
MKYRLQDGVTVYDSGGCRGVKLYETAGNEYVHLTLDPGAEIPVHSLPLAVSFYVLNGSGTCQVSGNDLAAVSGEMLECPPDAPRGWRNDSSVPLELLVIKRQPKISI